MTKWFSGAGHFNREAQAEAIASLMLSPGGLAMMREAVEEFNLRVGDIGLDYLALDDLLRDYGYDVDSAERFVVQAKWWER